MILTAEQIELLAHHVVAINAKGWGLDAEDWPGLDEDQAIALNNAVINVGNFLARVVARDERTLGVDVLEIFERATRSNQ